MKLFHGKTMTHTFQCVLCFPAERLWQSLEGSSHVKCLPRDSLPNFLASSWADVTVNTNWNICRLQHGPTEPTHHDLIQSMAFMLELAQHGWIGLARMRDSSPHSYDFFFWFKAVCGNTTICGSCILVVYWIPGWVQAAWWWLMACMSGLVEGRTEILKQMLSLPQTAAAQVPFQAINGFELLGLKNRSKLSI